MSGNLIVLSTLHGGKYTTELILFPCGWLHVADTHSASCQFVMLLNSYSWLLLPCGRRKRESRGSSREDTEEAAGFRVEHSPHLYAAMSQETSAWWMCQTFLVGPNHHPGLCCGPAQPGSGPELGWEEGCGPKNPASEKLELEKAIDCSTGTEFHPPKVVSESRYACPSLSIFSLNDLLRAVSLLKNHELPGRNGTMPANMLFITHRSLTVRACNHFHWWRGTLSYLPLPDVTRVAGHT